MPTEHEIRTWRGRHVVGDDGHKIGTIDELYADDQTGQPDWALVHTGLFGRKSSFLPISQARQVGEDVHVPFDKTLVKDAPGVEPDGHLSAREEADLFRHYGHLDAAAQHHDPVDQDRETAAVRDDVAAGPRGAGNAASSSPGAAETAGGLTARARDVDDAMTLSEEQVRVGTRELPATKVRMRKVTITENVQVTVPITREEVRLEEVPIDAPDADDALPPDGEVTLRQEVPVIEKATVDSERVWLAKDRVTEQVEVTEPVRHEKIDVEHPPADDRIPRRD